ncbi:MAG TPA: hypothetical protein VIV40_42025 [Kofleriaceae bacterium]
MQNLVKILLLISVVACSKGDTKPPPPKGSAAEPAAAAALTIYVDDQPVGKLALDQVKLWPRLDTLVPVAARRLGTWQLIELKGPTKTATVNQPSATYPELVPALFPADGGAPAFGMFDPVELAKHGKPALREDGINEIRVKLAQGGGRGQNDTGQGGGQDPREIELTIKTASGEQVIKGDKLLETPREPQPGETGEGKGWTLAKILGNAGVKSYERLLLTGEGGTNLTLEKQDLDPKVAVPFVKLNRQGSLRFRVFKKEGNNWLPGQDLRGLARVEILK